MATANYEVTVVIKLMISLKTFDDDDINNVNKGDRNSNSDNNNVTATGPKRLSVMIIITMIKTMIMTIRPTISLKVTEAVRETTTP